MGRGRKRHRKKRAKWWAANRRGVRAVKMGFTFTARDLASLPLRRTADLIRFVAAFHRFEAQLQRFAADSARGSGAMQKLRAQAEAAGAIGRATP